TGHHHHGGNNDRQSLWHVRSEPLPCLQPLMRRGSIVLPQGSAAFRAIVACYPFCPEEAPALASDVQIFIRDADDWAWHRTAPLLWKNTARPRRIRLSWLYSGAGHSFDANQPDRLYFGILVAS